MTIERPAPTNTVTSSRRSFLRRAGMVGTGGLLIGGAPTLLAACAGESSSPSGGVIDLSTEAEGNQLVGLFNYTGNYLVTGSTQRLPFVIATPEGPPAPEGPATLSVRIGFQGVFGDPIELRRHDDGVPIGYYPLLTQFDRTGIWTVATELDGREVSQSFAVQDPATVPIVQPGAPMPAVATPTDVDARGIDPICTLLPTCPFHGVSLDTALSERRPVVLLIGTPMFCQTAVCGPVLELLMEIAPEFGDLQFIHTEVYAAPGSGSDPASGGLAPVVEAFGLSFEPSLFVANPNTTVNSRLDNIYDREELRQALRAVSA